MAFPSPTKTYHTASYPGINPELDQLSTRGKTIAITGGGSGIGADIALAFAKSGATNIALLGRTASTLSETKERLEASYPNTTLSTYIADLVDKKSLELAFKAIHSASGPIEILIANAGYLPTIEGIGGSDLDDWYKGFEINVKGNFNLVKAFIPHAAKDAALVNISTGVVHLPFIQGFSGYHTSKLAAAKLFDYVHQENPDFFVLNVHPGVIKTSMNEKLEASGTELPYDEVELPAWFVVWAVSPEARFLNGKFVWAHWDVEELKQMAMEIKDSDKFTLGLLGWP